jgi:stalled ribosome rescue protein Dom34
MSVSSQFIDFIRDHQQTFVLSVYVEGGLTDPAAMRAWLVKLREAISTERQRVERLPSAERHRFEEVVARMYEELPSHEVVHAAGGWCFLGTEAGDVFTALVPMPVATSVTWQRGTVSLPYLASQRNDRVFVLQIDHDSLHLHQCVGESLQTLEELEATIGVGSGDHMGDSPGVGYHSGTRGSTATDQLQRRKSDARSRLENAAHQRVTTLMQTPSLLVIGGAHEVVSHFVAELPESIGDRVIVAEDLRMHTPPAEIVQLTHEATEELLAERQVRWFAQLREQAFIDQHAALGPRATARVVPTGAVEQLMLTERYRATHPSEAETMALETLLHGGAVSVASAAVADELDRDAGGVAARLRYAVP